jgi:endonuclease/exonuclease/phosphatase family metal-dependent hydrolase
MKRSLIILSLAISALWVFVSCTPPEESAAIPAQPSGERPKTVRIATWNLEWFGALDRGKEDIARIAGIIKELDIDILALEEITCPCTLEQLAADLPGYDFFLSPQRIPQKLALLWRKDRVDRAEFDQAAYDALRRVADTGLDYEMRQPLVFRMKVGEFDFTLMVVHLKSGPEAERSLEIRNIQYDTINEWLRGELEAPEAERDIIIAGDFNSYNSGVSSERLLAAGYVIFATSALPEGDYSEIWYDRNGNRNLSLIDHIALSATLRDGEFESIEPIRDWDVEIGPEEYERGCSDHLPLVTVFKTNADLD